MVKLTLHIPLDNEDTRKREIYEKIVREIGNELGIEYDIIHSDEETFLINIDDEEASTLLYIEDNESEDYEQVKTMVKVLATIALSTESTKIREKKLEIRRG